MGRLEILVLATAVAASLFAFAPGLGFCEDEEEVKNDASDAAVKEGVGVWEEPYNIMGNELKLQTGDPETIKWPDAEDVYWRVLFPLKTDGRSSGFFGYLDCIKKENGVSGAYLYGPVNIEDKQVSPFSAEDFRVAVKNVDERSLFFVVDLNQYYTKEEERENFNPKTTPGIMEMTTPITVGTIRRFEGKYASLMAVKTAAGWDDEGLLVRIDLAGDLPVPPLFFDESSSFVIVGDEYYDLERRNAKAADGTAIGRRGGGTTAVRKRAEPPFRYEYVVFPFQGVGRKKPEVSLLSTERGSALIPTKLVTRGLSLSEDKIPGKELTVCFKIPADDRYYAPAYVVANTKLYEGRFVSAVNTECGSSLYFDTNMIDEYINNFLKKGTVDVIIIHGKDDVIYKENDAKGEKPKVLDKGCVTAKSGDELKAQAFVTLDRQLKEGDRVKLEIKRGDLPILTIDEKVKEVKGSAFKDERYLSVQTLFEHEFDINNVRVKVDYSDFQPVPTGRCRWFFHGDMVNSEATEEEYVKGDGSLFILGAGGSRFPVRFSLGPSVNGSYFPNDPAEFRHVGFGAVSEFVYYAGNKAEQKYLWRVSFAPEGNWNWDWEREPPVTAGAPFGERIRKGLGKGYFPLTASYNFDGVRFEGKAAPSYLSKAAREAFDVKYAVPLYVAFTASLDPKFVHGLPRGLDSQSAVAVNFTYELGRDPLRFERLEDKFSLGFEYAPVKK